MKKQDIVFFDLKRQYRSIGRKVSAAVRKVAASGRYILGEEVRSLEREFAEYCALPLGIGVASGTEALCVALMACGIKSGDEVITVANAGVPTVCAITMAGAIPVFVDIDPEDYTIDPAGIERKITKKTKAIIPVHLYGQCADMDPIVCLAKKKKIAVIEDACQAHGALYKGKKAGSIGDAGAFSFYPTKNLGCFGDGGMVVTGNRAIADKARMLREYGQRKRYFHVMKGINSRMDEIQAAVLKVKLSYLDEWNRKRAKLAAIYNERIVNKAVTKPAEMDYGTHVWHLYVISCKKRDRLKDHLKKRHVQTLVHYPVPVYLQKAYAELKASGRCPVTEMVSREVLSLPLYPEMTAAEAGRVLDAVNKFQA
ncbi:DegT/DnrJ/EryC1/StrS family aminotransferase [Candidatus Omnitrophota bacterium]